MRTPYGHVGPKLGRADLDQRFQVHRAGTPLTVEIVLCGDSSSGITSPLFAAQGGEDTVVPLSEAGQLVAAVRGSGTPQRFVVYEDQARNKGF